MSPGCEFECDSRAAREVETSTRAGVGGSSTDPNRQGRAVDGDEVVAATGVDRGGGRRGRDAGQRHLGEGDGEDRGVAGVPVGRRAGVDLGRSEEHTSELQSLMRISYAVFCLKKKTKDQRR